MMGAAQDMGLDWKLLDKWIRPEKCEANCGKCALGCTKGAKWTAREYIEEAQQSGAELLLQTTVDRVLTKNGKALGVRAKGPQGWMDIKAETVILSAGGQGTPPILQRSGVYDAGQGFFADPLVFVMGAGKGQGTKYDVTMTAGTIMADDGIVMTDLIVPPLMFSGLMTLVMAPKFWTGV